MERWARLGVAILLIALGSACTPQGPLVRAGVSPSPTSEAASPARLQTPSEHPAAPPAEPTPIPLSIGCDGIPGAADTPLVLMWAPDHQQLWLENLRSPALPATLCRITTSGPVKFVSDLEIGYVGNSSSNDPINGNSLISRMSLTDITAVPVVAVKGDVMDFAWSPDGLSLAYLLYAPDGTNRLWLKTGSASPRPLTPPIPLFGRDGSPDDQILVRFSPDGKYLLMVDTYVAGAAPASPDQAIVQVRAADGSLVFVPPSALGASGTKGGPTITMATWAHQSDRLFYRDLAGVHTWDPSGTVATTVAGLSWYSPTISTDDRYAAYMRITGDNAFTGQPYVEVRDLASNTVRDLAGIRSAPWFLSDTQLLEQEYGPNPQPGPGWQFVQTGRTFVFSLTTNVETQTPIAINPIDTWPRIPPPP